MPPVSYAPQRGGYILVFLIATSLSAPTLLDALVTRIQTLKVFLTPRLNEQKVKKGYLHIQTPF